jgi:hypothetical protein
MKIYFYIVLPTSSGQKYVTSFFPLFERLVDTTVPFDMLPNDTRFSEKSVTYHKLKGVKLHKTTICTFTVVKT